MPRDRPPPRWTAVAAAFALRECVRFARQPARIVAALGTAALLWLVVGAGFAGALTEAAGVDYRAYLVPGAMTLVAVFAAIFSNLALIEDRREGVVQGVLVSSAPRSAITAGIVAGGAAIATAQALLLLPLLWTTDAHPLSWRLLLLPPALFTTAAALQALGLCFAWRSRDSASYHAVMNLLFAPLWLLSDAFFAAPAALPALRTLIALNPLSWCGRAIRSALLGEGFDWWAAGGALAFAAAALVAAVLVSRSAGRLLMERA